MQTYAISLVRDEADIIATNVRYHLAHGIDKFLIADNGSTDGTLAVLRDLARDSRVSWTRQEGDYRQSERLTELAREASRAGADWVLPVDADEFWFARAASLKTVLATATAGALRVEVRNFVQARHARKLAAASLQWMARRAEPLGRGISPAEVGLVDGNVISYVELRYPPKWISSATPELQIAMGNHEVQGIQGERRQTTDIVCLHAPLRSREILEKKAEEGIRFETQASAAGHLWQFARWARLKREGLLDDEWAANSYCGDSLDVWGVRRPAVFDTTLLRAVAPFLP